MKMGIREILFPDGKVIRLVMSHETEECHRKALEIVRAERTDPLRFREEVSKLKKYVDLDSDQNYKLYYEIKPELCSTDR